MLGRRRRHRVDQATDELVARVGAVLPVQELVYRHSTWCGFAHRQIIRLPGQYTRCLVNDLSGAPAAAARRLNDDDLIGVERQACLAGFVANLAVALHNIIMPGLGIGAAMQPVRSEATALALQGDARGMVEAADRAHETVAAAMLARSGRALAQFVALDPERIGDFER